MESRKILKICKDFKDKMQKIVDEDRPSGVDKITIQVGTSPPVVIAEKKKD